jgi:DNA-binding beta-propeller fold protein YncE
LSPKKTISGDYYLERSENNLYYLQRKGHEVEGVGLVEGTVEKAGWSGTTILVLRHACFRGDPDGWMIIDTKTNKVEGPISDSQRQAKFPSIVCYPVEDAWNKL